jgi:NADPH:quinone reductase-like Zn-dependent oxidoreductase
MRYCDGFAEYVSVSVKALARKPATLTFEEAAAIPQAGVIALQGIIEKGKVQAGQSVLINGAGGGAGTFAVQLAKLYGAEVTGVDNAGKLDFLRSLGADHVIDYAREDFTNNGKQYDLILDVVAHRSAFAYSRALRPNGMYFCVGGSVPAPPGFAWHASENQRQEYVRGSTQCKDLVTILSFREAGKVMLYRGRYPLSEVPAAPDILEESLMKSGFRNSGT